MATKVKSGYCAVCGRQSKFTKETRKYGSKMMGRASAEMNPLAAASGGMMKLGGAAFNAAKSYRCVTCGSKMGAKSEQAASVAAPQKGAPSASGGPEAGWYNDPQGQARLRYWDGQQWTDHTSEMT